MQRVPKALFLIGTALLVVATGASLLLAFEHWGALSLPGCGEGSPCARAAASAWGSVPGLHWPTAFLGLAYFAAALLAWLVALGRVSKIFRAFVRLGALISLGFVLVLLFEGYICNYCLAAHLSNFAFFAVVELATRPRGRAALPAWHPVVPLVLGFLVVSAGLGVAEVRQKGIVAARQESERAASAKAIIESARAHQDPNGSRAMAGPGDSAAAMQTTDAKAPTTPGESAGATEPAGETMAPATEAAEAASGEPAPPWQGTFTGRYRRGPEKARIRIVVYTDYQCPDCKRIETEIEGLLEDHPDISFSSKHFPMCRDCNVYAQRTLHLDKGTLVKNAEAAA